MDYIIIGELYKHIYFPLIAAIKTLNKTKFMNLFIAL